MAERVNTGGMMDFDYSKSRDGKLNHERRREIEDGYRQYEIRKRIERKRRFFFILLLAIILAAGLLAVVFNYF